MCEKFKVLSYRNNDKKMPADQIAFIGIFSDPSTVFSKITKTGVK